LFKENLFKIRVKINFYSYKIGMIGIIGLSFDTITIKCKAKAALLKFNNSQVLILGSEHTRDSKHPQFSFFRSLFEAFNPEIVLTEGGFNPSSFSSSIEAIKKDGERGFMVYLCKKNKIKYKSADPPFSKIISFLTKKFPLKQVFIFLVLNEIADLKKDINKKIKEIILILKKYKAFRNLSIKSIPKNFLRNRKKQIDPNQNISLFNEIAREESRFRDDYTKRLIFKLTKRFHRIIVLKGMGHFDELITYYNVTM